MKILLAALSLFFITPLFSQQWNYDNAFNSQHALEGSIDRICVQTDGKYVVTGAFILANNQSITRNVARLNNDGTIDTTFAPYTNLVLR